MRPITIQKVKERNSAKPQVLQEIDRLSGRISERAFQLFQSRAGRDGCAVDDWFRAERDFVAVPQSELTEDEGGYRIRVNLPGFDPANINVTALPECLIVNAFPRHNHKEIHGDVHFCEFDQKTVLRRFDFRSPVNVDKISVAFENGVLQLSVPKVAKARALAA